LSGSLKKPTPIPLFLTVRINNYLKRKKQPVFSLFLSRMTKNVKVSLYRYSGNGLQNIGGLWPGMNMIILISAELPH
jgi:hypothetical protein